MCHSAGGSVLAVAAFNAGSNGMGLYHPADVPVLIPEGVPDTWLSFLSERTGDHARDRGGRSRVIYGPEKLARRDPPRANAAELPSEETNELCRSEKFRSVTQRHRPPSRCVSP